MRTTTYCYPWDLHRLGVEDTVRAIVDHGFAAVDLAATYHPIDALTPRGGLNLFSDARGAVYFPARAERYARIKPKVHSPEIAGAWPAAAEASARAGLGLNSWTITLFQPWIVDAHPDCARVMPWGDRSGSGVCPANPDVRDYIVALCADLADLCGVALFRLEGVLSHMFDLDWLRGRTLVHISQPARMLSNLCFCQSCETRGRAAGIDVSDLRARVVAAIEAEIVAEGGEGGIVSLAGDEALIAYTETYANASVELTRAVAERVAPRAEVSVTVASPWRALLGEARDDAFLTRLIEASTQVDLNVLNIPGNPLIARLNAALAQPRPLSALFVTVRNPTVTTAAMAAASGADQMQANLQRCADLGVRELSLYSFGLLPDGDVRDFIDTVGRLTLA
jgi:hypothetical protein